MKNLKLLSFIICCTFTLACKKDRPVTANTLVGEWELTAGINGLTGIRTNYERGKGNITKYTQTTYEKMHEGHIISKGTYTIKSFQSFITKKEEKEITYEGIASVARNYFTINRDTLIISVDAYDAPSSIFVRIN